VAKATSGARADRVPAFVLPPAARAAAAAAPAVPAAGLLALQDVLPPAEERRRRAVRRGTALLDGLAELQRQLLGGADPARTLQHLQAELARSPQALGEAPLDDVLRAIETRCAVEIAKRDR
jgi:hypothetical protein